MEAWGEPARGDPGWPAAVPEGRAAWGESLDCICWVGEGTGVPEGVLVTLDKS